MVYALNTETPAAVIQWLLDQELAGRVEGMAAVVTLTDGTIRYISLRQTSAPPGAIIAAGQPVRPTPDCRLRLVADP